MPFDEEPEADVHDQCRFEIERLEADLAAAKADVKLMERVSDLEAERGLLKEQVVDLAQKLIIIVVENLKMINMAGESIGTDPSLRTSACVQVLADQYASLRAENNRLMIELKLCNRSRKWWKDLAYAAGGEKISCRAATIKKNESLKK